MIRTFSSILIVLFVIAAVFGAAGMALHMDGDGFPCPPSVPAGVACPTDQVLFAIHHLGAYEVFARAIPALTFLSLIIFLSYPLGSALTLYFPRPVFRPLFYRDNTRHKKSVYLGRLIEWLSLFELSPSF